MAKKWRSPSRFDRAAFEDPTSPGFFLHPLLDALS
jgi:hypothetical protein